MTGTSDDVRTLLFFMMGLMRHLKHTKQNTPVNTALRRLARNLTGLPSRNLMEAPQLSDANDFEPLEFIDVCDLIILDKAGNPKPSNELKFVKKMISRIETVGKTIDDNARSLKPNDTAMHVFYLSLVKSIIEDIITIRRFVVDIMVVMRDYVTKERHVPTSGFIVSIMDTIDDSINDALVNVDNTVMSLCRTSEFISTAECMRPIMNDRSNNPPIDEYKTLQLSNDSRLIDLCIDDIEPANGDTPDILDTADYMMCHMSNEVCTTPVKASDGHVYELLVITRYIQTGIENGMIFPDDAPSSSIPPRPEQIMRSPDGGIFSSKSVITIPFLKSKIRCIGKKKHEWSDIIE